MFRQESTSRIQRMIDLASSRTRITAMELSGRKSTLPNAFSDVRDGMRAPGSDCQFSVTGRPIGSGTVVGHESILGYKTVKIANDEAVTSWYSLEHGCALLQQRVAPAGKPVLEKTLYSLLLGEPSADLFDVAANFQEVSPSGLVDCKECGHSVASGLDREYFAHRRTPNPLQ
jgi:hypothetical protein